MFARLIERCCIGIYIYIYGLDQRLPWYVNVSVRFHVPLECRVRWQALLLCLVFRVRLEPTSIVPGKLIGSVKNGKIATTNVFSARDRWDSWIRVWLQFCAVRFDHDNYYPANEIAIMYDQLVKTQIYSLKK